MATLNVLTICGSLRKGSFNAMVQRALPSLAPEGMTLKPAPSFARVSALQCRHPELDRLSGRR